MAQKFDLIIRGAFVAALDHMAEADVGVIGARTAAIGDLSGASADHEIDAKGLHLLPGVIDSQVHFREPGLEHKEDLASGAKAAVLGGVTAVFEMPNTNPSTTDAAALRDKLDRAAGRMWCDHAFYVGATSDNAAQLAELERLPGCAGVKVFMGASTGDILVPDDDTLARVLASGARRVAVHAEDNERLDARKHIAEGGDVADHPNWRDGETAFLATQRIVGLARKAGRRIHVLHVTTEREMAFLGQNKDIASVETTPQHLTLRAPECYREIGTFAQMNPPIRNASERDGLWRWLRQGVVDVIGSDHAPHTKEEKARPYPKSPAGMPGVQTLLPLLLTHMAEGRLSLARLVDLTSAGAQRIFGLRDKGRLAVGWHADYTLVDLKAEWIIDDDWLAYKCGWSPFTGRRVVGRPIATLIRGRSVMRDGELIGDPEGKPVRFLETIGEDEAS